MTINKKRATIVSSVIVSLVVLFAVLQITHITNFFGKKPVPRHTASEYTKGEDLGKVPATSDTTGQSSSTASDKGSTDSSSQPSTASLVQPTGNFVSSHHVSLSSNSNESSTCNTTPGALCRIYFTNGDQQKTLLAKTTDGGGAAYWSWNVASLGLTAGTWKIAAEASLNGKQSTATDAMDLVVTE